MAELLATPALTSLRDAIGATLAAVPDLGLLSWGYVPSTAGTGFPVAFVEEDGSEEVGQSHNWKEFSLIIYVMYGDSSARDVQELIDRSKTGTASITRALRTDETFGGTCIASTLTGTARPVYRDMAGYQTWGVSWDMKATLAA